MYEDLAKDYDLDEVSLEILKGQTSKSQALKYLKRFPKKVAKKVGSLAKLIKYLET